MAITLTSSGGGLFDRIGMLGAGLLDLNALRGGTATARVLSGANWATRVEDLEDAFGTAPANRKQLDGIYQTLNSWQSTQSGFLSQIRTIAQNTLIAMANDDTPLSSQTVANAMALLISQMIASVDSVNASASAAGAQTAVGTPTGNAIIAASVTGPAGVLREYVLPEAVKFVASTDAQHSATARRETLTITTPAQVSEQLAQNWPGGSGVTQSLTLVDPAQDSTSTGNLLANSDFEAFTANVPDNWSVLVGTAGVDIVAAGAGYTGTNALRFLQAGGSPLSSVSQTFNVPSGGTTTVLLPNTVYCVNVFGKKSAGLSGAGALEIGLVDGTNTLLQSDAAVDLKVVKTLSALTTGYTSVHGFFQTPKSLPATTKLRVRLSTAIADSGESVYLDDLALTPALELYQGGPYVAAFAGSTNPLIGDTWTVAVTNTWGLFQQLFQQLFDMRQLGLQLPSNASAAETLADALIV